MVPEMLQSACRVDVTNFPFDRQKCRLVFTPWTHTQRELDMRIEDKVGVGAWGGRGARAGAGDSRVGPRW